ncbi:hypothetical protein [Candidatus Williamhamiltonella defendens]|uniref:hypothetical protein n=1 Tax=Candidatus Williamhamiltonella defendens TaxID=138072 RepID=UPI00138F3180|nr:hypothetical protein [Candidatus Hamiltonella defensa]
MRSILVQPDKASAPSKGAAEKRDLMRYPWVFLTFTGVKSEYWKKTRRRGLLSKKNRETGTIG